MTSTIELNRTKRGEVYQFGNNFTFVCVHCSSEFNQFTEFTLHVQIHFDLDIRKTEPASPFDTESPTRPTSSAASSTDGSLIAPDNIKTINESYEDFEFISQVEVSYREESSECEVEKNCEKKLKPAKETTYECFICQKALASPFVVRRHMKIHRHNDLKCKDCHTVFRTSRYFERHNCMSHPNRAKFVSQMPIQELVEQPKIYECVECKRIFRDRRQMQNHMTKHKQSPCLCLICGKLFSGDRTLSRHMKLHTSFSESHPCNQCGRKFKQRRYLLDHNRKVHNLYADEGEAVCDVCNEQFENKRLLYIHKRTHPFVEKRNFPCTMCNHSAKCAYDLRRHIETHSMENRSYECPICQKKLLPRYANDHMKSHDETRHFECNECGKQFKRAMTLKRHQSTHQQSLGIAPTFKCDICPNVFARMDGLLRHRRRHPVAMNFHCRICNKGFIEQKSFLVHEANHTKGNVQIEESQPVKIEESHPAIIEENRPVKIEEIQPKMS